MDETETWCTVAVPTGLDGMQAVTVGPLRLALIKIGDELFCVDNVCTHAFALLTEGWLEDYVIECPLHAGQFDVRTGCGLGPPISRPVRTYPVRIAAGSVQVRVPA